MPSPFFVKNQLVSIGKRLAESGLIAGTDGNMSMKLDDDRIMITPKGFSKGHLSPDDLVIVDTNGKKIQGSHDPSSEIAMHLFVYKNRPEVQACVHSHPPYATAFAVAGIPLEIDILPEVVLFVGEIPLTDYAPPGTDAVPKSLEPFIESCSAFLLRNHGLLTIGRTLDEAMQRHETVEHYAKILHHARMLGNLNCIPPNDFARLENIRKKLDDVWSQRSS
ncbi:MAG: class II aldolase/adducin family protein [candidate division Zixibacteria bacterium]|nr:class II aldolase/adducin family protein [candidate division Zixibacteria bacterium]